MGTGNGRTRKTLKRFGTTLHCTAGVSAGSFVDRSAGATIPKHRRGIRTGGEAAVPASEASQKTQSKPKFRPGQENRAWTNRATLRYAPSARTREERIVTRFGNLRRLTLAAASSLLFCFALAFGANQNPSPPTGHPPQSSGPVVQAQTALARGNSDEAIQILSDHLQSNPTDTIARRLLGQAYASAGQDDRAAQELQTALQSAPDDFVALAALGEIYARGGQAEKAEPLLARAVKISRSPQIRIEWAVVLAHLHKYKEAQAALASSSPPSGRDESIQFHRLKASVALGLGNASAAATEMESALTQNPTDDALTLATAAAQLQAKNWKRAAQLAGPLFSRTQNPQIGLICLEAELESHADFHPTLEALRGTQLEFSERLPFRQHLAELLISHGKYAESIADLEAAASLDPSRSDLTFNLALAQFQAGRLDDASASVEKCKQLGDAADLEDLAGDIEEARGDSLAAVKSYQAAVGLAPNEEKYRLSMAVELIRHSNFDAARLLLKQAEISQPKSWRIALTLGMIEYFGGTDEAATKYLLQAADLAPDPQTALKYLGDIQMDRPTAPDATAIARLCAYADGQPKNGLMQYYCGGAIFRRDYGAADNSNAEEILKRLHAAERLMPNDASPHCQLGKAYRWLEKWHEALSESETCARLDPNSAEAHFRLAQIYQHVGEAEKSKKEMELYEATSLKVADENARRDATMKTFIYTIQNAAPDKK
jgi:tetratricopeptide (TPR) repeat protein